MSGAKGRKRAKAPDGKMTIGALARRTGMTIRNIRAHQTRGLLPPPEVHGRTGYYGEAHVARIELTREMQAEGLNLEAIRRVLETTDGGSQEIVDFARAIRAPFEDETPEIFDAKEIAASWKVDELDPNMVRHSEALGVLRELPDGKIEVISPRLHRAATELIEFGVSPEAGLALADKLHKHAEGAARAYVDLFVKEIWEPFARAGRPEEDWRKVREALEGLRPLASGALLAMFQITMGEATEKAAERTLRNAAKPPKRSRSKPRSSKRRRR
ncbi:MAG TPA: MerR family transcriptional regulator [Solirubrobacterales bacterium]|jgi:DNA-binding transcriptional MerR regulator|nr:MerR family transcriptional regulator [Solirubrobacterales bacterium]